MVISTVEFVVSITHKTPIASESSYANPVANVTQGTLRPRYSGDFGCVGPRSCRTKCSLEGGWKRPMVSRAYVAPGRVGLPPADDRDPR